MERYIGFWRGVATVDIEYLLWLQGLRQAAPSAVQAFFSFLGSEAAAALSVVLPCVFYWCLDKSAGAFSFLAYGSSSLSNQLIKNTACVYRPWIRDVRVTPDPSALAAAGGYSFPSGHTQSAISMMGGLGWWYRSRRWPLVLAFLFAFLIGFSRNVLGVHAPQDVVVGFVEGCLFVLATERLLAWVEKAEGRDVTVLVASALLTVVYLVYTTCKGYPMDYVDGELLVDPADMLVSCYKAGGVFLGIVLGWVVERRFVRFTTGGITVVEGVLRVALGALIALVGYKLSGVVFIAMTGELIGQFIRHAVVFFLLMAGAPALFAPLSGLCDKKR